MTEQESRALIEHVLRRIAPEADLDTVPPGADLRRELDIDSMDFLEFVSGLAKGAGIAIPERDYPKVANLETCIAYLVDHTATGVAQTA